MEWQTVDGLALLVGLDPVHEVAHLGVHARAAHPTQICSSIMVITKYDLLIKIIEKGIRGSVQQERLSLQLLAVVVIVIFKRKSG